VRPPAAFAGCPSRAITNSSRWRAPDAAPTRRRTLRAAGVMHRGA
jgi:hypothetical protein